MKSKIITLLMAFIITTSLSVPSFAFDEGSLDSVRTESSQNNYEPNLDTDSIFQDTESAPNNEENEGLDIESMYEPVADVLDNISDLSDEQEEGSEEIEESEESEFYIDLDDNEYELTEDQAELMECFIQEYENQLEFTEEGINNDNVDIDYFEKKYGDMAVEMVDDGIDIVNERIEDDELAITENGTIYEVDDTDMVVQGRYNKTSGKTYWWGRIIYQSYSNANKQKKSLKSCSKAASLIGDVCTVAGGAGSTALWMEGVAALGIRAYSSKFASSIGKYNKKNIGIKYKIWWSMNYTMRSQNQKW